MDTRNNRLLEFSASSRYNRDLFLLLFRLDYERFVDLLKQYEDAWLIIGRERDKDQKSQAGLVPLQGVCQRSLIFAFDALQGMQLAQVWPCVRIGLETLLIMGKIVCDSKNAEIWHQWNGSNKDRRLYKKTFQVELGTDNSLPRAASFRAVLTAINDEFLHPNPRLLFSPLNTGKVSNGMPEGLIGIETHYLGHDTEVMETHTLALVRLFADMVDSSIELLQDLYGKPVGSNFRGGYESSERDRAVQRASADAHARAILQNFGAWSPMVLMDGKSPHL